MKRRWRVLGGMAVAAMLAAGMAWGEGTTEQTEPEAAGLIPDTEAAGPRHAPWVWFGNLQLGGNEYDVQDGLGLGLMAEARKVRGIQVFLFGLQSEEMDGLQIAGFGNLAAHANGVQLAGFFNFAHLGGNGLQIALFGNEFTLMSPPRSRSFREWWAKHEAARYRGIQIAGFGNGAYCLSGIQLAGYLNSIRGNDGAGAQIALGFNGATDFTGVQASLLGNFADELHGLQLGLFNRARGGAGVQIGLVNGFGPSDDALWLPLVNAHF